MGGAALVEDKAGVRLGVGTEGGIWNGVSESERKVGVGSVGTVTENEEGMLASLLSVPILGVTAGVVGSLKILGDFRRAGVLGEAAESCAHVGHKRHGLHLHLG